MPPLPIGLPEERAAFQHWHAGPPSPRREPRAPRCPCRRAAVSRAAARMRNAEHHPLPSFLVRTTGRGKKRALLWIHGLSPFFQPTSTPEPYLKTSLCQPIKQMTRSDPILTDGESIKDSNIQPKNLGPLAALGSTELITRPTCEGDFGSIGSKPPPKLFRP